MLLQIILLLAAIAFETAATSLLKYSDGMSKLWPTVGMLVGYVISLFLLSHVLKTLPVGPVYATWSALGTATTAFIGFWFFGDKLSTGAWAGIGLIILGVIVLSFYAPPSE